VAEKGQPRRLQAARRTDAPPPADGGFGAGPEDDTIPSWQVVIPAADLR